MDTLKKIALPSPRRDSRGRVVVGIYKRDGLFQSPWVATVLGDGASVAATACSPVELADYLDAYFGGTCAIHPASEANPLAWPKADFTACDEPESPRACLAMWACLAVICWIVIFALVIGLPMILK
jgi:hypothetical protein